VSYRVFAQLERPDPAALVRSATRYFEASLEVLSQPSEASLEVRVSSERRAYSADFVITSRRKGDDDQAAALRAELSGRSAGMAALAGRCEFVWCLSPSAAESPPLLNLCAIVASVALGPVLPADESALFGVRGAMERFERLVGRSLSR